MSGTELRGFKRFQDLVFSDLQRYRPGKASWFAVLSRCTTLPGLIASLILRAQQVLFDQGHVRAASMLRSVGVMTVGIDLVPGGSYGRGLLLGHPTGVVIGAGITVGDNVSLAGGVTFAMREPLENVQQEYATVEDGVVLGAHAVVVGGVRLGKGAMVGSNAVVLSDVPEGAVVFGIPARQMGARPAPKVDEG